MKSISGAVFCIIIFTTSILLVGCDNRDEAKGNRDEAKQSIAGVYRNDSNTYDSKFFVILEDGTYAVGVIPNQKPLGYIINPESGLVSFEEKPALVFDTKQMVVRDFNRTYSRTAEDPNLYREDSVKAFLSQKFSCQDTTFPVFLTGDENVNSSYHKMILRRADGTMQIDMLELYPDWKKHVNHRETKQWAVNAPYYISDSRKFLIHYIDDQKFRYLDYGLLDDARGHDGLSETDYSTEHVGFELYPSQIADEYRTKSNFTTGDVDGFVLFENLDSDYIENHDLRLGMTLWEFQVRFPHIKINVSNKSSSKTASLPNLKFGAYKYKIGVRDVRNPGSGFQITYRYLSVKDNPAAISLEFVPKAGTYILKRIELSCEIFPNRTRKLDGCEQFDVNELGDDYTSRFLSGDDPSFNIKLAKLYMSKNPWLSAERFDSYKVGNVRDSLTPILLTGEQNGHTIFIAIRPAENRQKLTFEIGSL